jgi:hypothetical protein
MLRKIRGIRKNRKKAIANSPLSAFKRKNKIEE